MTNRGDFYNPVCLGRGDEWYGRTNPNRAYSSNTGVNRIDESNRVGMQRISLCESGYNRLTPFNADVPKFRSLPPMRQATNRTPDIYREWYY